MKALHLAVRAPPPPASTQPLQPRRRRCRPAAAAGGPGDQQGSPADADALLQRAAALRAQQEALEREAAQLAAALEGLPTAEQRAVLQALGAQRQQQVLAGGIANMQPPVQQQQQEQQEVEEQQGVHQPPADAANQGQAAPAAWEAALPPELRQVIRDAGMEDTLLRQAEAVRAAVGEEGEATGAGNGAQRRQ